MKLDLQLTAPLGHAGHVARSLAEHGLDGTYTFEGPHDVFFPLVEAALATAPEGPALDLYTNVAIAFPRSPIHLAHAAWDLQRLTDGRFLLGLGPQVRTHIQRRYGARWERPVDQMREVVQALRAIFATWQDDEPLHFEGEFTTHTFMPPLFNPGPLESGPPPVWLGAVGPRMTRLAGEVADGLLVHPFHSQRWLRGEQLPRVHAARAEAGRAEQPFGVGVGVIVACGRTPEEQAVADDGARALLSFYGATPAYRGTLETEGRGELQPRLDELARAGHWHEMGALIDEPLLEAIVVRGTPGEVAERLRARYEGVADRLALSLPYAAELHLLGDIVRAFHRGRP
ncbi:MAG: TIGR03617 family F420-dependent LLM class oxidoreductase [Acidimicrobiales bacterium]|nr:TIGR03617 family F420-dependent LLM class oxidoreductase [Acidimicrobiales bacterium]